MPKFAIDIDNVVADWAMACSLYMQSRYGTPVEPWQQWDWYGNQDEFREFWHDQDAMLSVYADCEPIYGAVAGVQTLATLGTLTFPTHRHGWTADVTASWFESYNINVGPIMYLHGEVKGDFLTADLWIDDKVETIESLLDDGQNAYLFDRPHNRRAYHLDKRRAYGWDEVISVAKALS